jgi:hypothetical protein
MKTFEMSSRKWSAAAALLIFVQLTSSAHAQAPRLRLDYEAPETCPEAERLTDEVGARLGRIPFSEDASESVRVRVFADGAEFVVTIDAPEAPTRAMRGSGCEDVVLSAASALATLLDTMAPASTGSPPTSGPSESSWRDLMLEIDQLEEELSRADTFGANAMLISGIAATVVGLGGIGTATTIYFLDPSCRGESCNIGTSAAIAVSGAVLVGGVALLTVGASMLPPINARRRQLQRRIDERRRILDRILHAEVSFGFGSAHVSLEF